MHDLEMVGPVFKQAHEQLQAGTRLGRMSVTSAKGSAFAQRQRRDLLRSYILKTSRDVLAVCAELSADPEVEYSQPNYTYHPCKTPNDPEFANQYAHQLIQMEKAWDISTGSRNVIVALIGTGVDVNHPDLKDNIWVNTDEIPGNNKDDDGNGFIDDVHGWNFETSSGTINPMNEHETQVAGVAALLFAHRPSLTHMEAWAILENTTDPLYYGDIDPNMGYIGAGHVNAYNALLTVDQAYPLGKIFTPMPNQTFAADGNEIRVRLYIHGDSYRADFRMFGRPDWTAVADGSTPADPNGCVTISMTTPGVGTYEPCLHVTKGGNVHTSSQIFAVTAAKNQAHWPAPQGATEEDLYYIWFRGSPICMDVDGNGRNEIVQPMVDYYNYSGLVNVWTEDGNSLPNWTLDEGWAWGEPTGKGSWNGDPSSGHTGKNVIGYALDGDYANNLPQTRYAATGPIHCTGYKNIHLSFWRWLGVESPYDYASVQVSNDGVSWTDLWTTGPFHVSDSAWQFMEYAVPAAVADGQTTVHFRWGMGPTDEVVTYPGWNIDDVQITGDPL
jgi:hypothetical protein